MRVGHLTSRFDWRALTRLIRLCRRQPVWRESRSRPQHGGLPGPGPARTDGHPRHAAGRMRPYRVDAPWAGSNATLAPLDPSAPSGGMILGPPTRQIVDQSDRQKGQLSNAWIGGDISPESRKQLPIAVRILLGTLRVPVRGIMLFVAALSGASGDPKANAPRMPPTASTPPPKGYRL